MKRIFLTLSGVTKRDRNQVISDINAAISASGGWIVNHTSFSNIAITLQMELPRNGLEKFQNHLSLAEVVLQDESCKDLQKMALKQSLNSEDIKTALNVTFIHDEPDVRRQVVAVPG
ncbi:MAG: hypothetical protein JKX94_10145 [Sneathiella sp.]|nr:hypothetical protein [Sneathiella sp.]